MDTAASMQRDLSRALDGQNLKIVAMDDPDLSAVIADLDKQGAVNFNAETYQQLSMLAVNFVIRVNADIVFRLSSNGYHLDRVIKSNTEFLTVASRQLQYLQNEIEDVPFRLTEIDFFPYDMQASSSTRNNGGSNLIWKLQLHVTNRGDGPLCFDPAYTLFYYQSNADRQQQRKQTERFPVMGRRLINQGFCLEPKANKDLSAEFQIPRSSLNGYTVCVIPLTNGAVNASSAFQNVNIGPNTDGAFQPLSDTTRRSSCWDG